MNKNKLPLIALIFSFLFGIFGGTVAYYSSSSQFTNNYQTGKLKTKTTESLSLPSSWSNGQSLSLGLTTKNEGTIPVAVRVSYTVTSSISNPLELTFANTGRWVKEGNYYYYRYIVNPNEVTKTLVSSVKNVSNVALTCNNSQGTFKTTCYGSNNVTLQFNVETVDIDKYQEEWNTSVAINEFTSPITSKTLATQGTVSVGDYFNIGNEGFYVVSTNSNETVLLAKYNINVGPNKLTGPCSENVQCAALTGSYGTMAFSTTDYWTGQVGSGLKYGGTSEACGPIAVGQPWTCYSNAYVYDENSNLYSYIQGYKTKMEDKRLSVNYARLMNEEEYNDVYDYNWSKNTKYWLGNVVLDNNGISESGTTISRRIQMLVINNGSDQTVYTESSTLGVRPVLVVPTSDLLE